MSKQFRTCTLDQPLLLPPSLQDWLPENHLARFIADVTDKLDLSQIMAEFTRRDGRGMTAYHPVMMARLLLYGYCKGIVSSRQLERATYENVAFRFLAADQHPDHDSISAFRQTHLQALAGLFTQALQLCQKAGLVKLGHVAIDGTKLKANASKHKAMSYDRMPEKEKQLREEVDKLLAQAAQADAKEDAKYGAGKQADELPAELARRESRLQKIAEAKASLEQEARELARIKKAEVEAKLEKRRLEEEKRGKKFGGRPPQVPDPEQAKPEPKAQRNFTDPDSRIMLDGATKSFMQAYNAQAVATVDQVIVAAEVTNDGSDDGQFVPMVAATKQNLRAAGVRTRVRTVLADAGYWSKNNVATPGVEALIAPGRTPDIKRDLRVEAKRAEVLARVERGEISTREAASELGVGRSRIDQLLLARKRSLPPTPAVAMTAKLATPRGRRLYKKRSATIEPVFGQTKHNRGIRRFARRGMTAVNSEWKLIAATHNILKLWRHPNPAYA